MAHESEMMPYLPERMYFPLHYGLILQNFSQLHSGLKFTLQTDAGHAEVGFTALTLTPTRPIKHAHMW